MALAPDDETSLISLSSLLVSENRDRQARDLLDQAHRRFPNRGRTTHALARLLAACPDAGVCDGDRALKLALQVYRSTQFVAHGETVAMALAQVGRCQEAAEWQRRMVAAAERANEPALATRLQQQVVRYGATGLVHLAAREDNHRPSRGIFLLALKPRRTHLPVCPEQLRSRSSACGSASPKDR